MSEKKYTERDLVDAQRCAFDNGVAALWGYVQPDYTAQWPGSDVLRDARYPLPKTTRPRVVSFEGYLLRVNENGEIEARLIADPRKAGNDWYTVRQWTITRERIQVFADLLANPTEEVEDGE